jgi:hypothetical protein
MDGKVNNLKVKEANSLLKYVLQSIIIKNGEEEDESDPDESIMASLS